MERRPSTVRMGPISVFALVIILCLAVLGVLSVTSASAGSALAQRQAEFAADDYRNEIVGQSFYAHADDVLAQVRAQGGDAQAASAALEAAMVDIGSAASSDVGVPITLSTSLDGGELEVRIQAQSGRCLDIEFAIQPDATLSVAAWKATTLWTEDATDHLWTGGAAAGDADGGDGVAPAGSTSPTGGAVYRRLTITYRVAILHPRRPGACYNVASWHYDWRSSMRLDEFLKEMIEAKASDVFIVAGLPIAYRVGGRQQRIDGPALMPQDTEAMVRAIYEVAGRSVERFLVLDNHDEDFSFALPGIGRFRANVFRQRGSLSAVIRVIPFGLPDPKDFNIPEAVLRTAGLQKGLVLVTGPAGSGKSTTLACIIDRINRERSGHIITMEDPIEYVHKHGSCIVTQREVPTDIATYGEALRSAMREAPDVILLGEMRDADTIGTAVTAAEMAQLIFSTLHTTGASGTVDRIIDAFPPSQQRQIRLQLSMVLQAIVSQQLVPAKDGGLVPAFEIMLANTAIRNLIREEKTHQMDSVIAAGGDAGMQTMDQSLFDLVQRGIVDREVALMHGIHQEALEKRLEAAGL